MIKRMCDCCGEEIKSNFFIKFRINWNMAEVVRGRLSEQEHNTLYLEYCEDCFNKVLENLGLEKE